MFTGLVQECAEVLALEHRDDGIVLSVLTVLDPRDLAAGASICCNGACLTVLNELNGTNYGAEGGAGRRVVSFFVGPTTLAKTQLATLKRGDRINLEPALRMGDPLGGHHVSGHVDGCAQVLQFAPIDSSGAWELVLLLEESWLDWVVDHGSVAVRGTSLTIASVDRPARRLSIMLIPHTLAVTNLADLKIGSRVEMEFDMQIKALVQTAKRILPHLLKQSQVMPAGQSHA